MLELKKGVDILTETGGVKSIDEARKLFEEKLAVNLVRAETATLLGLEIVDILARVPDPHLSPVDQVDARSAHRLADLARGRAEDDLPVAHLRLEAEIFAGRRLLARAGDGWTVPPGERPEAGPRASREDHGVEHRCVV